jgi:phospholipid/cholesterol/gamma-HCH transport system substrate-binding protein
MTGMRPTMLKLTIFGVISALLFLGLFRMMSNSVDGDLTEWHARFTVVSGLREGDDVRVAGVKVGRVEQIEVTHGSGTAEADVTFTMREDQEVYEGTRLTLRYQNLLGQRYLALSVLDNRGERVDPGTGITSEQTSPGFDLTALLNGFEPLFSVLEPAEVNQLASSIVAVLQGESGTVESLLRHTAEATRFVADREEVFDQVLSNLTPVLQNLDAQSAELDATVVQFRKLMTGLAHQKRTFAGTIDHLGSLVQSTSSLLRELRPPLTHDVDSLRRTTALLFRERPRLARTLDALPVLLGAFARSMSYGAYLNIYMCNLGFETGGQHLWLNGNAGPYSRACRP